MAEVATGGEVARQHRSRRDRAGRRALRGVLFALGLAGVVAGIMPPPARASVYWGDRAGRLGRANLDGSAVVDNVLGQLEVGGNVCGVAVDRNWLYFVSNPGHRIGRATVDGQLFSDDFITGLTTPCGIAVDGQHIYWADSHYGNDAQGTIGRANLDGSGVNAAFITGLQQPCAVAVDGGHVYWSSCGTNDGFGTGSTIGRANLNGSSVDDAFITGASGAMGVAVDSAHIYWTNNTTSTIGRANLNGTSVDQSFITAAPNLPGGPADPTVPGIAVDGAHVYWNEEEAMPTGGSSVWIGRASADGTVVQQHFVRANSVMRGIAVDAFTPTQTRLTPSTDRLTYGEDLQLFTHVASVAPASAQPVTGIVAFSLDQTPMGTVPLDSAGNAAFDAPFLIDAGTHVLGAHYGGDGTYATSHRLAQLTVDPAGTRTTMRIAPNPATLGQPFDLVVTVANTSNTGVVPFGSVAFFAAGMSLGSLDLDPDGTVSAQITADPADIQPGTYTITADYTDTTGTPPDFTSSRTQSPLTLNAPTPAQPSPAPSPAPTSTPTTVPAPTPTPAANPFAVRSIKVRRGVITVTALAPGRGVVRATAASRRNPGARTGAFALSTTRKRALYRTASVRTRRAGRVSLVLRPTRAAKKALSRGAQLRVRLSLTFTPESDGRRSTITRTLTIKR